MLRTKILVIIALCIILLSGIIYTISSQFLLESYKEIETTSVERNLLRVAGALTNESASLNIKLRDWAQWDDTYHFMEDRNQEYIVSNLADETLINLEINLMTFITANGEVIFSKQVDLIEGVVVPHEATTREVFEHISQADGSPALEGSGIITIEEQLLLFEALPIIYSDGSGVPNGTLIFARFLDNEKITHISELTQLQVDLLPYALIHRPESKMIKDQLSATSQAIIPTSNSTIEGYFTLNDIEDEPVGLVRVTNTRDIFLQGVTTVNAFTFITIGSILIFGIVILFLLESLVLRRFMHLTHQVENIDITSLHTAHIRDAHTNDEIGKLALKVNTLLVTLSKAQEKERTALMLQKKTNDELKKNLKDLENINKLMVGREIKMMELKQELDTLKDAQK